MTALRRAGSAETNSFQALMMPSLLQDSSNLLPLLIVARSRTASRWRLAAAWLACKHSWMLNLCLHGTDSNSLRLLLCGATAGTCMHAPAVTCTAYRQAEAWQEGATCESSILRIGASLLLMIALSSSTWLCPLQLWRSTHTHAQPMS